MFDWLGSFFSSIKSIIGQLTAGISVLFLVILFFLFDFKFLIRSYWLIRKMFKKLSIPFSLSLIIPWRLKNIDKQNKNGRYRYLKAFCEFAIFETSGQKISGSEWFSINQKFFYEQLIDSPFTIKLDSSFDILDAEINDLIVKYFSILNKNSKKLLHNTKNSKFTCKLSFRNGFVYPASFINGLERKFSDSWTDLLVKYNYTLKNSRYHNSKNSASIIKAMDAYENQSFITTQNNNAFNLKSNELFMMYSWLMWSPSYQMSFNDDKYKIILYGIGDESNTTNLILDTSSASLDLWEKLKSCMDRNVFGVNLSIECELYEIVPFVRNNLQNFSVESMPLLNNLLNNSNDVHFILSYLNPTADSDLRNSTIAQDNDAFFSGYLWAAFGRKDEVHTKFDIKNTVVFFEHTNLADSTSVDYFTKALANKTVLHFKDVLKDENPSNYYLALCVAKNFREKYIELVKKEVEKQDEEFKKLFYKYVDLSTLVPINEVLENIDEEFPLNEFDFVKATKPEQIGHFYSTIYVKNFPLDERDSIDDLMYRTLELKSKNHHDILLAYQGDELAGGIVYDYFEDSNCGIFEYIVVDPKYRGMRVAKKLISKATAELCSYAKNNHLDAIFIEIEDPEKLKNLDAQAALDNYRRLQLWSNNKFYKVDIDYIQPALSENQNRLDNLMLAANTLETNRNYIDGKKLASFLVDFNKICNRVENVYDEGVGVKEMLDQIKSKPNGKVDILTKPIEYKKYKPKK